MRESATAGVASGRYLRGDFLPGPDMHIDRRTSRRIAALALLVSTLAVTGCFASQLALAQAPRAPGVPGFLLGLWHGFIAPIGFIVSLFSDTVRLYAVPNVGRWYDFGFMLGVGGFSGGIFAGSSKQRPRR